VYVCLCNGVTENDIREAAAAGCASMTELTMRTGAGANCGCCVEMATQVLAEARAVVELPVLDLSRAA